MTIKELSGNLFSTLKLIIISFTYGVKRLVYDIYFIFKKKYKYNIIFIAGLPMSATTKVKNMCGFIPGYFTRYSPTPYEIAVQQDISDKTFKYCPKWSYTLFKTHLNPTEKNLEILRRHNVNKVVVTYRDLRDVVLARYHRLLKFPKKKNDPNYLEFDKQYKNISKSDGINDCIKVVSNDFVKWIFGWKDISKKKDNFILFCKFEDLIKDPKLEFKKILKFYEIELNESLIDNIVENTKGKKTMEENFKDEKFLPWALSSNFRSGKIGGWKEEFDSLNIDRFKKECGDALVKLGYEKDLNW